MRLSSRDSSRHFNNPVFLAGMWRLLLDVRNTSSYLPSVTKKIDDEFTGLKVSRERKRQLRKNRGGLCFVPGCDRKDEGGGRCRFHTGRTQRKP